MNLKINLHFSISSDFEISINMFEFVKSNIEDKYCSSNVIAVVLTA